MDKELIPVTAFYNEDSQHILFIDYFNPIPKYQKIRRDNYFGYQNNCIESRIYFNENLDTIYEVYFDRKDCDGKIKMIIDYTGEKKIIKKSKK